MLVAASVIEGHNEQDLRVPDLSLEVLMQDVAASLRDVDSGSRKDIKSCTLRTDQYASDEAPEVRTLPGMICVHLHCQRAGQLNNLI